MKKCREEDFGKTQIFLRIKELLLAVLQMQMYMNVPSDGNPD